MQAKCDEVRRTVLPPVRKVSLVSLYGEIVSDSLKSGRWMEIPQRIGPCPWKVLR